jgi:hypothetical protein
MEIHDEFFEHWAELRSRLLGAHLTDQTQTEIYQQGFARNIEILDAVSNTHGHKEWNQRLKEAHQRLNLRQNPPQEPRPLSPEAPEQPTSAPAPEPDPTQRLITALPKSGSPLGNIRSMVREPGADGTDNGQNWTKALLCACLSELVYLRMSQYEVPGRDRYKVIPSSSLRSLFGIQTRRQAAFAGQRCSFRDGRNEKHRLWQIHLSGLQSDRSPRLDAPVE